MKISAAQVFRHSGIEIVWGESTPCPEIAELNGHTAILVRVIDLPPLPDRRLLGRANHANSTATIFYKRVCAIEKDSMWKVDKGEILGHAMAHEIGHLLLRSDTHSLFGIMKADYDRRDLVLLGQGNLLFSSEESGLLRNALVTK